MKKKLKNFFTLSRKADGGFTLVELIVVIAILAILGGVAVPAYSGYVAKAERAGDEQLLATINKAYAAACLMEGTDIALVGAASMKLDGAQGNKTVNLASVNPYGESFRGFYAGNEDAAFKVFQAIVYDSAKGRFVNIEDAERVAVVVNGKVYVATGPEVLDYLNSTLGQNLTSAEVADAAVDTAAMVFQLYGDSYVSSLLSSGSYSDAVKHLFGVDYETYMYEQFEKWAADEDYDDLSDAWDDWEANKKSDFDKNLMILASVNQANKAGETILSELKTNNGKQTIINNLTNTGGANGEQAALGLSQAALAYGLYMSYATEAGVTPSVMDFTVQLGDANSGFNKYLNGDANKVQADLDGLLGAMNVISTQDKSALDSAVANGIDQDADLAEALKQILGK